MSVLGMDAPVARRMDKEANDYDHFKITSGEHYGTLLHLYCYLRVFITILAI